ncbi:unnamed protein product, partial [Durusdinium trenchii]
VRRKLTSASLRQGGAGAGRRGRRAAWQVVIRRPERRQHRRRLVFWLELGWKRDLVPLLQAFLAQIEAIRLITCTGRFQACYRSPSASEVLGELCGYLDGLQGSLNLGWEENLCEELFLKGDGQAVLRGISMPLQRLVELALPAAAPPEVGNYGSRFHFEYFFAKRAEVQSHQRGVRDRLTYPPIFSPGGICSFEESGFTTQRWGPNASRVLEMLSGQVPLSRFVVNFGAADGECGSEEDWNADPANCLTTAGYSALVVEGDQKFFPQLRRRFGHREDVHLVLHFLPLSNITELLEHYLSTMPSSSRSPDLLKALRVLRPKVIHVEYMPQAPPPLEYVQHYQPSLLQVDIHGRGETLLLRERLWKPSAQFIWSEEQLQKKAPMDPVAASVAGKGAQDRWTEGREMTGCSLSAFLLRAEGYALFAAGDEEAVLVREDLQALLGPTPDPLDAWLRGSFCNPWRLTNAPDYAAWGFDFRLLVSQSVNEQREALELLLKAHGAKAFSLTTGEKQRNARLAVLGRSGPDARLADTPPKSEDVLSTSVQLLQGKVPSPTKSLSSALQQAAKPEDSFGLLLDPTLRKEFASELERSGLKEITPQSSQQLVEIFGQVLSKQLEAVKTQAAQLAAKLPTKGPLSFEQVLKALNQEELLGRFAPSLVAGAEGSIASDCKDRSQKSTRTPGWKLRGEQSF